MAGSSRVPTLTITAEIFGLALGVGKAVNGHGDNVFRLTTGDVLALAAMALCFHHRIALGFVVYVSAITSAGQFHNLSPLNMDVV